MGTHPHPKGHSPSPIFGPCLLWQNGWMDQDTTWWGDRPRHCVKWGPSSPQRGTAPNFRPVSVVAKRRATLCYRWGPSSPSPNGSTAAPIFGPCIVAKRLDGSRCYLVRSRPRPCPHCVKWVPLQPSPSKGHSPQFSAHVRCGQRAGWIKMPLGT